MHKVGTFHSPTQKEALAHTGFTTFGEPTALPVNVSRYNTISHNYQATRPMAHRTSHEPVTLDSSKKKQGTNVFSMSKTSLPGIAMKFLYRANA